MEGIRGNVLRNVVAFAQRDYALRMLFLAATPRGTPPLRLGVEQTRIWNALHRSLGDSYQVWPAFGVTARSLHGLIDEHPWDVVHFSGHGDNEGAIVLKQEGGGPHRVDPGGGR